MSLAGLCRPMFMWNGIEELLQSMGLHLQNLHCMCMLSPDLSSASDINMLSVRLPADATPAFVSYAVFSRLKLG